MLGPGHLVDEEVDWPTTIAALFFAGIFLLGVVGAFLYERQRKKPESPPSLRLPPPAPPDPQRQAREIEERRRAEWAARARAQDEQWRAQEAARLAQEEAEARAQAAREEEARRLRFEGLTRRFGPEVAHKIMRGMVWRGQTVEELFESLGHPATYDEKVLKTKTKRIYKWGYRSGDRYDTRVTVENGIVVGWER